MDDRKSAKVWQGGAQIAPTPQKIEVIGIPEGEAPEWVRREWRGLNLPLALDGVHDVRAIGVLSAPKTWVGMLLNRLRRKSWVERSYVVDAPAAIEILAGKNAAAADWWRSNTPHLLKPGASLLFTMPYRPSIS